MEKDKRILLLKELFFKKIVVLDGAAGTFFQSLSLDDSIFKDKAFVGLFEYLNLSAPEVVEKFHIEYLKEGVDIIETNTFGGTSVVLSDYGLENEVYEINYQGAQIARRVADKFSDIQTGKIIFVAGSMGPTSKSLSVTGGIEFDELVDSYLEQCQGLYAGGVDYFLLETCIDTSNIKAGLMAIRKFFEMNPTFPRIPVAVSTTIELSGTMLAGQTVESLLTSLEQFDLLYLGLNCATGPDFMFEHIRALAAKSKFPISVVPNAGLPDQCGKYLETPEKMKASLERFIQQGFVNVLGGCCGTTPKHIKAFIDLSKEYRPRSIVQSNNSSSYFSGIDNLEINEEGRPYLVGERTNMVGSKKFRDLIFAKKYDEAAEIAKLQSIRGAHLIDVCLSSSDGNEYEDMKAFIKEVIKKTKAPIMIDSLKADVIEMALKHCQGKSIINSINLEEGPKRFKEVVPIGKKYGAAFIVGLIDEDPLSGMAITVERKMAVAHRSYKMLTEEYGVSPLDIYWDTLVFPCGTGDKNYEQAAIATKEALTLLKRRYPGTKTALGISNISFGLPPKGREVLNSVFTYHCVQAGLDLAIVNTEKFKRYSGLSTEEIELSENLLWRNCSKALDDFVTYFRDKKEEKVVDDRDKLSLNERLASYVVGGFKQYLEEDISEALKEMGPLEIINGPLMNGMKEVGRLFNDKKLIVAEVLQSAEVMKAAVTLIEPNMPKNANIKKGKIILATVKGDVHDIGKNLVDIILSNNGFEVINLGIKIPSETIIQAAKEHKPDLIGLSGLLVKSAEQMVLTSEDLKASNIDIPVLVGGAALSRKFTVTKINPKYGGSVYYAKDAMDGLFLANKIMEKDQEFFINLEKKNSLFLNNQDGDLIKSKKEISSIRKVGLKVINNPPTPPDFERHTLFAPVEEVWKYVNPKMLLCKHLGVKGQLVAYVNREEKDKLLASSEGRKVLEIIDEISWVKNNYKDLCFVPKAAFQFFKAYSIGNDIAVVDKNGKEVKFEFERSQEGLCLSDYLRDDIGLGDNMAIFFVTTGQDVIRESSILKEKGEYLRADILQSLALETAEAYAEYLHKHIRELWGIIDPSDLTMSDLFQARYHGKRFSFGYPACPNLEDQKKIYDLIRPDLDIGLNLTESFMMEPESSVSALVFHHPEAKYFSIL